MTISWSGRCFRFPRAGTQLVESADQGASALPGRFTFQASCAEIAPAWNAGPRFGARQLLTKPFKIGRKCLILLMEATTRIELV